MKSARISVWVVVGWTLFMWVTRTRLIFTEDDLSAGDIVVRILPVFVFVGLVGLLVVSLGTGRPDLTRSIAAIAGWTTIYWLIRVTLISFHDHSIGFKIVHAVLAVISIGTVTWSWRKNVTVADLAASSASR